MPQVEAPGERCFMAEKVHSRLEMTADSVNYGQEGVHGEKIRATIFNLVEKMVKILLN